MQSSLLDLIKFWHFPDFILLILMQQLIIRLVEPIVCAFAMAVLFFSYWLRINCYLIKPVKFLLPSIYYATQSVADTGTILNALESKDIYIRVLLTSISVLIINFISFLLCASFMWYALGLRKIGKWYTHWVNQVLVFSFSIDFGSLEVKLHIIVNSRSMCSRSRSVFGQFPKKHKIL